MKLNLFASAWSFGSLAQCLNEVELGHFDGVEGPPPKSADARREWRQRFEARAIPYIAEICTGGSYAPPSTLAVERHLDDLRTQAAFAAEMGAGLLTCLAGSDSWPEAQALDFYAAALEIASPFGIELAFETHRSRPLFNPWVTARILRAVPALRLTCDFSHWCVVCERLVDDEGALEIAVQRARHVHARVGYAQGPQVPEPRAPEYARELAAHEAWWSRIWAAARKRGVASCSATPEFGPDGYLHELPFTRAPVASLSEINRWMAARQRTRFRELCDGFGALRAN